MSLYHHNNGDCSLMCRYCAWEDEQEAAERADDETEETTDVG